MFENLGGWKEYKEAMTKYTSSISDNYYSEDNVSTANTMNDVITYLYAHKDEYQELIDNMKKSRARRVFRSRYSTGYASKIWYV